MRKTYIDNNGFERYEDNCKIVIKKTYTKEETEISNEIFNTFKNVKIHNNNNVDYENLILARQEKNGYFDI